MTSIPETNLAVVIQQDRSFAVERIPVLKPGPGEVLLKVHAVAQNPSEWRAMNYPAVQPGTVTGSDLAGEVIAIGPGPHDEEICIGDRVAAFVQGAFTPRYAAFREYTVVKSRPLLRIPPNVSYEDASSIPLTACTAVLGFARLFNFPDIPPQGRSILIWGGSSSLGFYAIQLARLSNLHVIATASPKNFDAVKAHGAHTVIDYHSPDVVEQIRKASPYGDGVDYVLDALSEPYTIVQAAQALRPDGSKKVAAMLPVADSDRIEGVEYHFVFMATILGDDAQLGDIYFPHNYRDYELGKQFYKLISRWLESGKFKPNPITIRAGGLYGIPDGIQHMVDGKVSGTKLVYRIADTKKN